jgi:hypothetical protein
MTNGASETHEAPPGGEVDLMDALRELRRLERARQTSHESGDRSRRIDQELELARRRAWGLADALGREQTGEAARGGAPGRHRSPAQDGRS